MVLNEVFYTEVDRENEMALSMKYQHQVDIL